MGIKNKSYVVDIVKEFIEIISKEYSINSVYIFGSYCYGNPTQDSDIDIAVILNESVDEIKDFEIFRRAQKLNPDLEAVVFSVDEFNRDLSDIIVEIKQKGEKVA